MIDYTLKPKSEYDQIMDDLKREQEEREFERKYFKPKSEYDQIMDDLKREQEEREFERSLKRFLN